MSALRAVAKLNTLKGVEALEREAMKWQLRNGSELPPPDGPASWDERMLVAKKAILKCQEDLYRLTKTEVDRHVVKTEIQSYQQAADIRECQSWGYTTNQSARVQYTGTAALSHATRWR